MPKGWSAKLERQYEHIKEGAKKQDKSTKRAKQIAAGDGQQGKSAQRRGIQGRSTMTKEQLQRALAGKSE